MNNIKHNFKTGFRIALISVLFLLITLASASRSLLFAVDICGDRVYINIDPSGDCGTAPSTCPAVTGCTVGSPANIACVSFTCEVCCPDANTTIRDDTSGIQIITDVPSGEEQETAQTGFNTWASTHNYQTAPEGYLMTGTLEGFVYNTAQSDLPGTVDLNLTYWKRGFFTKSGDAEVTPIENLGDGGASVIADGVGNAIDEKFGEYESNAEELNTYTGTNINQNSLDNPSGLNSWDGFGPVVEDNMVTKITTFISSNPVLDIFRNSTMTASNPSCSFSVEVFGHEIEFSFCPYEAHFLLMGTLILGMATLYSLFIVLGKG